MARKYFEFAKIEQNFDYTDQQRKIGSGPLRLNEPLKIREDLYSRLFVCSLCPEYIYHFKKNDEEEQETKKKVLEEFKKANPGW